MKHPIRDLLFLCSLLASASCGGGCKLLFVPRIETYPAPIREVRVVDARTNEPIADAEVAAYVLPLRTPVRAPGANKAFWLCSEADGFPPNRSDPYSTPGSFGHERPDTGTPPSRVGRPSVTAVSPGHFRLGGRATLAWSQFLWPFRHPGRLYWKDYGGYTAVVVRAPGYLWQNLSFGAGKSAAELRRHVADQGGAAERYLRDRDPAITGRCEIADDGVATFFVQPAH